ncbi:MAG: methyl-accepting chemotaxis protein [Pseudomonadota bacterium]
MNILQFQSLQGKFVFSMTFCLLLFGAITSACTIYMVGNAMRDRVAERELPATVGEIRNDIRRRISEPFAASQGLAGNRYVLAWESAGLPGTGLDSWRQYASDVKHRTGAAGISWVSYAGSAYYDDTGMVQSMARTNASQRWFYDFVDSKQSYAITIDRAEAGSTYMLYISSRFDAGGGRVGLASLAYPIEAMADMIRSYRIGHSGFVYLARQDGTILIHRERTLADGKHRLQELPGVDSELGSRLLSQQAFSLASYEGAGGKHLVASTYLAEYGLYVIADMPESEVLEGSTRPALLATMAGAAIGGGSGLILIFFISRAIAAPIRRTTTLLGEIAEGGGDLTQRMPVYGKDEMGALAHSFNRFVATLARILGEVRTCTVAIEHASAEVSSGNYDLSCRTESQASSLEETAAAMEQLTATVRQNADHARQANELIAASCGHAASGGHVVAKVIKTMASISASSDQIVDIIAVIDGLAFQTNILALNAAVEAARAGEHGRGFAVVAAEVRTLAQRSASAAKDIAHLIQESVANVGAGGRLVLETGNAMEQIVHSVQQAATLMSEIAVASNEQQSGIEQVNRSIIQIDAATQQNAALVEEVAIAARSLQDQAARLERVVGVFKLDMEERPASAPQALLPGT